LTLSSCGKCKFTNFMRLEDVTLMNKKLIGGWEECLSLLLSRRNLYILHVYQWNYDHFSRGSVFSPCLRYLQVVWDCLLDGVILNAINNNNYIIMVVLQIDLNYFYFLIYKYVIQDDLLIYIKILIWPKIRILTNL